ncbi:MAG: peptide chain release factor N(5)-glutamine methyltransferase [Anaerolineales bacterium]
MAETTVGSALQAVRQALRTKGPSAGSEAQLLVAEAAGRTRTWVVAHPEAALLPRQRMVLDRSVERVLEGQPLPYVLGWWEFYGRRFLVTSDVLIPRPETEGVIEAGLEYLRGRGEPARILDIGTGSGCLAITVAAEFEPATVVASDLSHAALLLAARNAEEHRVRDRVEFVLADLVPPVRTAVDLLVANLPYLPRSRLAHLEVTRTEPRLALDGGRRGLDLILRLLERLPGILKPGGRAILEIDCSQAGVLRRIQPHRFASWKVAITADLAGRDRYVILDRPG